MAILLETESELTAQDIATGGNFFSYTATEDGWVASELRIPSGQLTATAATMTMGLRKYLANGTTKVGDYVWSQPKFATSDTHFSADASPVWLNSGEKVVWYVKSSNAGDSSETLNCKWLSPYGAVALAASGLDAIAVTDPEGTFDTFPKMQVGVWRHIYKGTKLTATQLLHFNDDGTTVGTTQIVVDAGGIQTVSAMA